MSYETDMKELNLNASADIYEREVSAAYKEVADASEADKEYQLKALIAKQREYTNKLMGELENNCSPKEWDKEGNLVDAKIKLLDTIAQLQLEQIASLKSLAVKYDLLPSEVGYSTIIGHSCYQSVAKAIANGVRTIAVRLGYGCELTVTALRSIKDEYVVSIDGNKDKAMALAESEDLKKYLNGECKICNFKVVKPLQAAI